MKKFTVLITSTLLMLLLFGGLGAVQADTPPPIPSSFYGEVQYASGEIEPTPGATQIDAYTDGGVTPASSATITQPGSDLIYALNVPGNTSDPQPTTVIFKIGSRIVATAPWVSGSNVSLDIHPPFPDAGGPYVSVAGEDIDLSALAVDQGGGVIAYAWDLDDDGLFDDAVGAGPTTTFTAGVRPIKVKATDSQGGEGFDQTDVIAVTLSGLTGQIYDGTSKSVTINDVSPYTTHVTYAGSETAPTNAGTYSVVVTVKNGAATIGTITGYDLVIAPRPITVTAGADTKVYDGDASSDGTPTITTGSLVGSDSGDWSQSFNDKHAGTGKTLTPSGTVTDGNSGANYAITFNPISTGVITARPLTVTAVTDTKGYDGTTDSTGEPTLSGPLVGGDTGDWSQRFADANAGTGKTLIPAGTITDGNDGNNYAVTFVNNNTGEITPRPITVTAEAKTKVFGSADPALTYTYTDDLVSGDAFSGALSRATGEDIGVYAILQNTLTLGPNYTITFVSANFTITAVEHVINLESGWNLVSFNLQPVSTAIADVLSSINGKYDLVYAWDASGGHSGSGNWMKYVPGAGTGNTLLTLEPTMGFWIHMTAADTLTVAGSFQTSRTINLTDDVGGWNLVGFPSSGSVSMPQALEANGVSEANYSLVYAYHAADVGDHWKIYDTGAPGFANDLVNMDPGLGYWIYVTGDPIWTVDY